MVGEGCFFAWLNSSTCSTHLSISKCLSKHWAVSIVTVYFKTWSCLQVWLCVANVLSAHQHKPFHHIWSTVMMCLMWHQPTCSKCVSALTLEMPKLCTAQSLLCSFSHRIRCPRTSLTFITWIFSMLRVAASRVWTRTVKVQPKRSVRFQLRGQLPEDQPSQAMPGIRLFGSKWHLPGGLLSSTASQTLIFRMKARSNCSTWDSRDSELWRRQELLLACSKGLKLLPEYLPGLAVGCHGQAGVETSPNRKKRWLGDLKDKSLHGVVLFIQDYNHNFLHIVLQEPRQKKPFLNTSCLLPSVLHILWCSGSTVSCWGSQHKPSSKTWVQIILCNQKKCFCKAISCWVLSCQLGAKAEGDEVCWTVRSSRSSFGTKEEMHSHLTASLWDGHRWS